jgi:hypothetical protein
MDSINRISDRIYRINGIVFRLRRDTLRPKALYLNNPVNPVQKKYKNRIHSILNALRGKILRPICYLNYE